MFKVLIVLFSLLVLSGCKTKKEDTKCYVLQLSFIGVNSKQIVCTDKPLEDAYSFTEIKD